MAIFNPEVPGKGDPNFLGYARDINVPGKANTGSLIKQAGDALEVVAKIGDTAVKNSADEYLFSNIDDARTAYTQRLEAVKANPKKVSANGSVMDSPADAADDDEDDTGGIPAADAASFTRNLKMKRAQLEAQGVPEDHYITEVHNIAKAARARWNTPEMRRYIDSRVKEITGFDPANRRMAGLMQDIMAMSSGQDKEMQRFVSRMTTKGMEFEGGNLVMGKVQSGEWSLQQGWAWYNKQVEEEAKIKRKKAERELQTADTEAKSRQYKIDFNSEVAQEVYKMADNTVTLAGIGPQKIKQLIDAHISGDQLLDRNESRRIGMQLKNHIQDKKAKLYALAHKGERGTKYADYMKPEEIKQSIDKALEPMEMMADQIFNNDWGIAAETANSIKTITENSQLSILKDENIGREVALSAGINALGGPQLSGQVFSALMEDGKLAPALRQFVKNGVREMVVQPDIVKTGVPVTAKKLAQQAADAAKKDGWTRTQLAGTYDRLINTIDIIHKTDNPEVLKNINEAFFSPDGKRFVSMFGEDQVVNGRTVPGKFATFNRLTQSGVTEKMFQLGGKHWQNYVNWAEETFGFELFDSELRKMNYTRVPTGTQIAWDSTNNQFALYVNGKDITYMNDADRSKEYQRFMSSTGRRQTLGGSEERALEDARSTIARLNFGLSSMTAIAEKSGNKDGIPGYLMELMQKHRIDFTNKAVTFPEHIQRAVIENEKARLLKEQERKNAKPGAGFE